MARIEVKLPMIAKMNHRKHWLWDGFDRARISGKRSNEILWNRVIWGQDDTMKARKASRVPGVKERPVSNEDVHDDGPSQSRPERHQLGNRS